MIRPDLIFSYWIFIWWIVYLLDGTSFNPKFIILLGIIETLITSFFMIYLNIHVQNIILFMIMFLLLKALPYYTLRNTSIHKRDILFTIGLFILYLLWCQINHFDFYKVATGATSNKYKLPGMILLKNIIHKINL